MVLGVLQIVYQTRLLPALAGPLLALAQPFAIANPYGLFAVMTTHRDELVIEGTVDGETWHPYGFPFKPGDVDRPPGWATPYQPRLDWQMWFAALDGPERANWIYGLVDALLRANPHVLAPARRPVRRRGAPGHPHQRLPLPVLHARRARRHRRVVGAGAAPRRGCRRCGCACPSSATSR